MSPKRLAIVCNRKQAEKAAAIIKHGGNGETVIASLDIDTDSELERLGLAFRTLEDYGFSDNDITEEGIDWFKSWSNKKIRDGKSIKELLIYRGISVWWLVNTWLYSSASLYNSIADVLGYVAATEHILASEKPDEVCCFNDSGLPFQAIREVCRSKNIPLSVIPNPVPARWFATILSPTILIYGKWMRNILRKTYWQALRLIPQRRKRVEYKGKVLIFSGDNWAKVHNLKTGKAYTGDLYFESVTEILTGKGCEVSHLSYPTLSFRFQLSPLREGRHQRNTDYKPFEHYLGLRIMLKAIVKARKLRKQTAFLGSKEFSESLVFHGIPIYNLVKDKLSFTFSRFMMEMITAAEVCRVMIDKEKPDLIIVAGETPYDRALIAVGRLDGIPVIGYQHGVLHATNMFYNNDMCDISPDGSAAAPYCPIASKAAVDGQYASDIILQRAKYPERDVVIIGQPRYDILARADEVFDKEKVFQKFSSSRSKKLVVWTTSPHENNREEYEREAYTVYGAVKKLGNDVQLITKLHPGERGAPMHHRVADALGIEPIVTEYSIYELLHACDAIITRASTTAIEAAILGKPIVVLDLSDKAEDIPYVKEGIALGAYSQDELLASIKSALYDAYIQAKLEKARQAFVYKYAYLQDGQASQRFADLIVSTLENTKSGFYGGESR